MSCRLLHFIRQRQKRSLDCISSEVGVVILRVSPTVMACLAKARFWRYRCLIDGARENEEGSASHSRHDVEARERVLS